MPEKLNQPVSPERKFLHDIATPLCVAKLLMDRLKAEMAQPGGDVTPEDMQDWLKRAIEALEKIERMHADHRAYLHLKEGVTKTVT